MRIDLVAGARPNFMKIAPLVRALQENGKPLSFKIVHTGQHYDRELNDVFFDELGIPAPDEFLGAGSGSHAQQTAKIMMGFEKCCQKDRPDCVLVVGVVNLVHQCSKLAITDTSIFLSAGLKSRLGSYGVVTLHRASNVDTREALERVAEMLRMVADRIPLVFPVHPRTRGNLDKFGISLGERVVLTGPLPYMDFLNLWKDAKFVLTDSGGLQEETTALGVPCITVRENTERPITVEEGTNIVAGTDPENVKLEAFKILEGRSKQGRRPPLWDGRAAERIVAILGRELV